MWKGRKNRTQKNVIRPRKGLWGGIAPVLGDFRGRHEMSGSCALPCVVLRNGPRARTGALDRLPFSLPKSYHSRTAMSVNGRCVDLEIPTHPITMTHPSIHTSPNWTHLFCIFVRREMARFDLSWWRWIRDRAADLNFWFLCRNVCLLSKLIFVAARWTIWSSLADLANFSVTTKTIFMKFLRKLS